jgi:deazaflavin-dependent oxidoreductase (nitroreductase family)
MSQLLVLLGVIALAVAALGVLFVLGWRVKSSLVIRPIIALSKRVMNPLQMRTAGRPGAYAAIIRHRGRTSGRSYETPVGVVMGDDDFLIALPYGTRAQWLRNVLAAGHAELVYEGEIHQVAQPQLVPMDTVARFFTSSDQGLFRALRVESALRLQGA